MCAVKGSNVCLPSRRKVPQGNPTEEFPREIPLGKTGVRAPCKGANVFLPSGGQVFQGAIALSEAGGTSAPGGKCMQCNNPFFPDPVWWKNILTKVCKRIKAKLAKRVVQSITSNVLGKNDNLFLSLLCSHYRVILGWSVFSIIRQLMQDSQQQEVSFSTGTL